MKAKCLLKMQGDNGPYSYWQVGEEVYRLQEYRTYPIQYDLNGIPMGLRWEMPVRMWPDWSARLVESCAR